MNDDDIIIEAEGLEEGASEEELEASESRAENKLAKIKADLEQTRKEKQEYLDGWQRAKADYANALRRFEEEKLGAISMGGIIAAQAFIPAIDSLMRAKEAGELPEGFAGIAKQLEDAAKKLGMERIGTVGEEFDPSRHEALGTDEASSSQADGTVTAVLEHGWQLGDRVVRAAKVRVAAS